MISESVTVTTSATEVIAAGQGTPEYPQAAVILVPSGGTTCYFGGSDVATADGFPVAATETLEVSMVGEPLYAIVTSSTQAVNVLRRGG